MKSILNFPYRFAKPNSKIKNSFMSAELGDWVRLLNTAKIAIELGDNPIIQDYSKSILLQYRIFLIFSQEVHLNVHIVSG